jgi:O-methyltransferase involved in polyketide biosynthesis
MSPSRILETGDDGRAKGTASILENREKLPAHRRSSSIYGVDMDRDFSTISPSARSILLMKGHTSIPFARQAAELVSKPSVFVPDYANTDMAFWMRVLHFETRYLGINQMIEGLNVRNFLEISSGYSFRGLDIARNKEVLYLDTDLPDLISRKKEMLKNLDDGKSIGKLELLPLNALDEGQFRETVGRFPPGEIAIINEGLLIYFSDQEKRELCRIIRAVLEEHGGYWITSDIYIRVPGQRPVSKEQTKMDSFYKQHNIEDNKFSSFDEAQSFFAENGFAIDGEEDVDISQASSYKYLARSMMDSLPVKKGRTGKIQTTWRLRLSTRTGSNP